MANIKNNNSRNLDCRLFNDMYMDFMLSKDDSIDISYINNCKPVNIIFTKNSDKTIIANNSWSGAKASIDVLNNIGYTAVDNGLISYEKDITGNDEFLELFTNSKLDLSKHDNKFFLNPVTGNTQIITYPIEKHDEYISLMGGFYQGFFKIDGSEYQTLPNELNDVWNFHITLRPKKYDVESNILNKRHPNNDGMFFYIGTRAENKFWELYKKDDKVHAYKTDNSNDYNPEFSIIDGSPVTHQYHEDVPDITNRDDRYNYIGDCNDYFDEGFDPYNDYAETITITPIEQTSGKTDILTSFLSNDYNSTASCTCSKTETKIMTSCNFELNDYFDDDYTGEGTSLGCDCPTNDLAIEDDYIFPQISLEEIELVDSNGNPIDEKGFYEIETDNKFIIFNQTKEGFTTKTWDNDMKFIITGKTDCPNINYFPYFNQTSTGYTYKDADKLIDEHSYAYNVFADIKDNALGLKLNSDGSISYRYLASDCNNSEGLVMKEEVSFPGIVKSDEWNKITLKLSRLNEKIMKLYIYVNGKLKLVSSELPILKLRPLNDSSDKQQGVPYNISIGGGTQGLAERVLLDFYNVTDYTLPLEKYFGGTFIGDIKEFSFDECQVIIK